MNTDIEQLLKAELGQVAAGVGVPPMPQVHSVPERSHRPWLPLLVAAVVATIVAGALYVGRDAGAGREVGPIQTPEGVSTALPRSGFLVGEDLYFQGRRVPGRWNEAISRGDALIAQDLARDWFIWRGGQMERVEADQLSLSPDGRYGASASPVAEGKTRITVFTIRDTGGEGIGTRSFNSGPYDTEGHVRILVNDAGFVLLSSIVELALWNPHTDQMIPLQRLGLDFVGDTPAGWVWRDPASGEAHIASVDGEGRLVHEIDLPDWDGIELVNPAGTWLLDEGEAVELPDQVVAGEAIHAFELGGSTETVLEMPEGWYATRRAFESDSTVLAEIRNDQGEIGLVRCDLEVIKHSCAQVDLPE